MADPDAPDLLGTDLPERAPGTARWLFADQLGPHFLDDDDQRALLVESTGVFARRRFHRRKAHLVLSAMRHRAAELGGRAQLVRAASYREGLALAGFEAAGERGEDGGRGGGGAPLSVVDPTSRGARHLVRRLAAEGLVAPLADRGHVVGHGDFAAWARGRGPGGARRLLMEDFYRDVRRHHHLLLDGRGEPEGGTWNFDHDNRSGAPRGGATLAEAAGVPQPWWPVEDDIDAGVREDLDRLVADGTASFVGDDGPRRFAVTRAEALANLDHFLAHRLDAFGTWEDAMLAADPWMAHSLMSVPLNLGLVTPLEVAQRAEEHWRRGGGRLASVEGFVRQVVGWREWVWHLHWHLGPEHDRANALRHTEPLPAWFADLDAGGEVTAACLSDVLRGVREQGWVHHVPRLMVLGGYALERGWDPQQLTDWFHTSFVDGYAWVMTANVVGMSQHADGGVVATKPYWSGGAYVDRMSDYCRPCRYDPKVRVGPDACPFTAGYWAFTARHEEVLEANRRTSRAVAGLHRLADADAVVDQERARGSAAP